MVFDKIKYMKRIFISILSISFIFGFLFSVKTKNQDYNNVCFSNRCFEVEVADTDKKRQQGLMFREILPKGSGMLFVFEEPAKYGFWMKNTYIPLDILWIDTNKKIVFIKRNSQPCRDQKCLPVYPDKSAMYVLEVNASEAQGLRVGDTVRFNVQ